MFNRKYSENTLSLAIFISSAAWGLYWIPLRTLEDMGIPSSWTVPFFNACPLIILLPLFILYFKVIKGNWKITSSAAVMIGFAFSFYSYGLLETTVIRATLLFYLSPIWSTIIGVIWLKEKLTKARIISISIGFLGLLFLLSQKHNVSQPLNIGDLFSVLSGICWAIGGSTLKRYSNTVSILSLATLLYATTTVISIIFALLFYSDPVLTIENIQLGFITAIIWSIFIMLPGFIVIFKVSQILFPGRVGILMMSEVLVAFISASILLPEETMTTIQWLGAMGIVSAGIIEVIFGYKAKK